MKNLVEEQNRKNQEPGTAFTKTSEWTGTMLLWIQLDFCTSNPGMLNAQDKFNGERCYRQETV